MWKRFKIWLSTLAVVGGSASTYEVMREQEFVVLRPLETTTNEFYATSMDAFGTASDSAFRVKSSRLKNWRAGLPDGTVVESVMTYSIPKDEIAGIEIPQQGEWEFSGTFSCAPKSQQPPAPPPIPPPQPPPPVKSDQIIDWGVSATHADQAQVIQSAAAIKLCVVDTGVDRRHPDLKVIAARNFTTPDPNATDDMVGHGTHTSGAATAVNNAYGVLGASQAQLLMAKVLGDNGSGTNDMITNGILWCVQQGANIISASLGGPQPSQAMFNAIQFATSKGIWFFAAAGNDGRPQYGYPAGYTIPGLFPVLAIGKDGRLAEFSNYGNRGIKCPGVDILSTIPGGYGLMSGTSMATPICAGVAAIYMANKRPMKLINANDPKAPGVGMPDALGAVQ